MTDARDARTDRDARLGRIVRGFAIALAVTLLVVAVVHVVAALSVRSVVRRADAEGIDLRPKRVEQHEPAKPAPASASTAPRAAAASTVMGRDAHDDDPLARLIAIELPTTWPVYSDRLRRARRDDEAPVPEQLEAWRRNNADALEAARASIETKSDDVLPAALEAAVEEDPRARARDAERESRRRRDEATGRLCRALEIAALVDSDAGLPVEPWLTPVRRIFPDTWWLPTHVLRRTRPADRAWADRLLRASSREERLADTLRWLVNPAPAPPLGIGVPELDAMVEDAPSPIRLMIERGVLLPAARLRWSRDQRRIFAWADEVRASTRCAPPASENDSDLDGAWRGSFVRDVDRRVTREVLRVAHPELGLEPTPIECSDWSIVVEDLADGSRRVRATGAVTQVESRANTSLEYVVPRSPAR